MGRGEYAHEPYREAEEGLPAGGSDMNGVAEIEGVLREIADPTPRPRASRRLKRRSGRSKSPAAAPPRPGAVRLAERLTFVLGDESPLEPPITAGLDDGPVAIPEEVPLARDPIADAEEDAGPTSHERAAVIDASEAPFTGCSAVAIAEPMTSHDASLVSLGENVKQVTMLIESVGRTLDAQNQRSLRLMERLEQVARALETLPEEADRNLEAMDSVESAIKSHTAPLERMSKGIEALPDLLDHVRESEERTRDMFSKATRAMASRMAVSHGERRREEESRSSSRRWRTLAGVTTAAFAFMAGLTFSGSEPGASVRNATFGALSGPPNVAHADESKGDERPWRVVDVKAASPEMPTVTAAPEPR